MQKLAINGGKPIRKDGWVVPFPIGEEEKKAVIEVLDSGWLSMFRGGPKVKEFEEKFAEYCGVNYAVATSSGTTALHTAVSAGGMGPGDEVIVPSLTFVSTCSVVLQQNAIPVFVDIEKKTFCISPSDLERKITRNTKAVVPVHLFGHPANMDEINNISIKYGLKVIEDAAQAHGASIKGRKTGSLGDFGCFSFFQTKNMTCGEGGIVLTNNKDLYKEARLLREHGSPESEKGWYLYDRLGYNYNMTEMQAAIALVQLSKLDEMNKKRIEHARIYREKLNGLDLEFMCDKEEYENVYHNFPIILPPHLSGDKRDWFVRAVSAEGVPIDICYPVPVYKTEMFKNKMAYNRGCPFSCSHYYGNVNYKEVDNPVAEDVSSRIVNLLTDPLLSDDLQLDIIRAVKKVLEYI